MSAQGKHGGRVEALLRAADAAPWRAAPASIHDRVMGSLDQSAAARETNDAAESWKRWPILALAAAVAITAGTAGTFVGAMSFRGVGESDSTLAISDQPTAMEAAAATQVVSRVFDDLRPSTSSRLVASVTAPMQSEAQGIAAETKLAAKTVLSRLPFVSME